MADMDPADVNYHAPQVSQQPALLLPSPDENVVVKRKRRPYRHKKFGGTVAEHIKKAVKATKERRAISVAVMKKMLSASGCKLRRNKSQLIQPVRSSLKRGSLVSAPGSLAVSTSVRPGNDSVKLDAETKEKEKPKEVSVFETKRNRRRKPLHRKKAVKKRGKPGRRKLLKNKRWARRSKKKSSYRKATPMRRSASCNPVCRPQEESNDPDGPFQSH